jgi:hypothetical protein
VTDEWAVTRLWIAQQLGPMPRLAANRDVAVARACDALDQMGGAEAAKARRYLAIEDRAASSARRPNWPSEEDWRRAVSTVDDASDADVRRWARSGMLVRAARGGWDLAPG